MEEVILLFLRKMETRMIFFEEVNIPVPLILSEDWFRKNKGI